MLSPQQASIIQSTVPLISSHGDTVTTRFYENLLRDVPCLRNVFNATHMATGHQPRALAGAILAYAQNITDISPLASFIEAVCHKHVSLGITEAQYAIVGQYLLASFEEVLGKDVFTEEVKAAWTEAYTGLADIMIQREKELYAADPEWSGWEDMEIVDKVHESDSITSFYLQRAGASAPASASGSDSATAPWLPTYLPGQYISVRVRVPGTDLLQPRQYSLSSHHAQNGQQRPNQYRISVKREKGAVVPPSALEGDLEAHTHTTDADAVSRILHEEKVVGDRVQISRPRGTFVLDRRPLHRSTSGHSHLGDEVVTVSEEAASSSSSSPAPVVLISAGVGITPMMSMLQYLAGAPSSQQQVRFLHAAKNPQTQAFAAEVEAVLVKLNSAAAAGSDAPRARAHFFYSTQSPSSSAASSSSASPKTGSDSQGAFTTFHPPGQRLSLSQLTGKGEGEGEGATQRDTDPLLLSDARTQYYVCGPAKFMADICDGLTQDFGVDAGRVRMEKFSV